MTDRQTQALADAALGIAFVGAREYLRRHGLHAEPDALAECVKSWARIKLPEALADAREAFAIGMVDAGVLTFKSTMIIAGIEAAKEAATAKAEGVR